MSRLLGRKARNKKLRPNVGPTADGMAAFKRGDPLPPMGGDRGKQRAFYKGYRMAQMQAEKEKS